MSEHRFFPIAVPDLAVNPRWWLYLLCLEIVDKGIDMVSNAYKLKGGRRDLGMKLVERSKDLQQQLAGDGIIGWYELDSYALRKLRETGEVRSNDKDAQQNSVMWCGFKDGLFKLMREQQSVHYRAKSGNWYVLEIQDKAVLYCNGKKSAEADYTGHDIARGVQSWFDSIGYAPQQELTWFDMIALYKQLHRLYPRGREDFQPLQLLITHLCNLDLKDMAEQTNTEYKPIQNGHQFAQDELPMFWRAYYRIADAWVWELATKEDAGVEPRYISGLNSFLDQLSRVWETGWKLDTEPKLNLSNETTTTVIHLFKDAMKSEKKDVASGNKKRAAELVAYFIHRFKNS